MTQPPPTNSPTISIEKVWSKLMFTMGHTNLSRAKQARKAANSLNSYWKNH